MTTINGKPKIIKEINMALVRKNIIRNSPITKPELSKLLGLSLPTINKCVDELLEKEIVKVFEGEIEVKGSGKKPVFYEINSNHVSYIAAYFKGTVLTIREYDLLGKIKNEKVKKLKEDSDEKVLLSILDKMIKDMIITKSINIIDTGIGPAFLSPSHPKLSGSPKTGLASVRTYARPLAAFIIAKVAIKGGTFNFAIQKPLTSPHTVPTPTAVAKIIPKETRIPASG